ncbi:MAG: hypothetical protein HXY35_12965 [Chloroflexi bacterium]|nr:hypothetical protein [Chloroflexota bacterium]
MDSKTKAILKVFAQLNDDNKQDVLKYARLLLSKQLGWMEHKKVSRKPA